MNILIVDDVKTNHEDVMNVAQDNCLAEGVVCVITVERYKELWQDRLSSLFVCSGFDDTIKTAFSKIKYPMSIILDHAILNEDDIRWLLTNSRHRHSNIIAIYFSLPKNYILYDTICIFPEKKEVVNLLGFAVVPNPQKLIKISLGGPAYLLKTKDHLPTRPPPRYVNSTFAEKSKKK